MIRRFPSTRPAPEGHHEMKLMLKLLVALLAVGGVAGALVGTKLEQFRAMTEASASMAPPPEVVTAAEAFEDAWERTLSSTGTLNPVQGVTVAAQVPGRITRIHFESGTTVSAGEVLVELDADTELAELRAAKANAALARADLERTAELRRNRSSSEAELDAAEARYEEAQARVQSIRTVIDKKTVRAPFAGRLGMRRVNLGEVLQEGDPVTTVQSLDPIYVDFSLPQQHLPSLALGTRVRLTTDAAPGEVFEGAISAISPEIDPATRNLHLQATIANPQQKLRGGMFAGVEVVLPQRDRVLAIPLTAVQFAPFGDSVFVVERGEASEGAAPPLVIRQHFVRLGIRRGDFVAVVEGLAPGERVVSSGVFKLRSGMKVVVDNTLAPHARLEPRPGNT